MALGEYEERCFRLLDKLFFYLSPFPAKWDYKTSKVLLRTPKTKYIPYACHSTLVGLSAWVCLSLAFIFGHVNPQPYFTRLNLVMMINAGVLLSLFAFISYISYRNRHALISVENQFMDACDGILKRYPPTRKRGPSRREFDVSVLLAFFMAPSLAIFPFILTLVIMMCGTDPGYFIVEWLLPDPKYRDMGTIITSVVCRYTWVIVVLVETARTAGMALAMTYIGVDRAGKILKVVLLRVKKTDQLCTYYTRGILLIRKIESVLHTCLYLAMTIGFWLLVVCFWTTVKCSPDTMSFALYAMWLFIYVMMIIAHAVGLPMLCADLDMAALVHKVYHLRAQFVYAGMRTKWHRILLMRTRAMLPIRVKYGQFWYINGDFLGPYMWLIVLRCFDAILVIDGNMCT